MRRKKIFILIRVSRLFTLRAKHFLSFRISLSNASAEKRKIKKKDGAVLKKGKQRKKEISTLHAPWPQVQVGEVPVWQPLVLSLILR